MEGPLARYRTAITAGALEHDPMQELAVEKLQLLDRRLVNYDPNISHGLLSKLIAKKEPRPEGLYMYGGVGRGKSMLMDMFFDEAPVIKKRRVHFHEFMLEVHRNIHEWRQMDRTARKKKTGRSGDLDDPIPPLAKDIADGAWLLCFDEFQVTDVADAMILSRLFTALFENGVVVVITSNRVPDDLYLHGINRHLFVPFIDLVKTQMDVLHLDSPRDYRMERLMGAPVYYYPNGPDSDDRMEEAWSKMTEGSEETNQTLDVAGRELFVPRVSNGIARFNFQDLCGKPLGSADYLEVAWHYHTVLIDHIPQMDESLRNEAKRFVTLIDAFYENDVKMVCSAGAAPEDLYVGGSGAFEFGRTVSRLMEMQSEEYLQQ